MLIVEAVTTRHYDASGPGAWVMVVPFIVRPNPAADGTHATSPVLAHTSATSVPVVVTAAATSVVAVVITDAVSNATNTATSIFVANTDAASIDIDVGAAATAAAGVTNVAAVAALATAGDHIAVSSSFSVVGHVNSNLSCDWDTVARIILIAGEKSNTPSSSVAAS